MNTTPQSLLAELQHRVSELFRNSPAADIERNLKAMLAQTFQRVDLVTRDEFDAQLERMSRLQERIAALEQRLEADAPAASAAEGGASQAGTTSAAVSAPSTPSAASSPAPSTASPDDPGPVI